MRFAFAVLLLVLAWSASAVETITIPVVSPYSGNLAIYGENIKNAALLREKEINAAGGIDGFRIKVQLEDDVGDPKVAKDIATKLAADDSVVVVVGHLTSTDCLAASPVYKAAGLSAISPTATNPALAKENPFYFRNVYKDDFQGEFLARYAKEVKGFKKIAVLYQTNDYSTALKNAFVNKAKELGITIVAVEAYNETTQDFKPMLSKFRLMGPDALFVPGYADQAKLVAAQTKGLLSVPMFGADGLDNDIMLEIPEANGTFVTTPFLTEVANDEAKAFIKAYEAAYGSTPNYMGANAYDAVDMAFKAAIAAKGDRTAVRDWLASHNSAEKAYQGVTGATFFDENGDCLKPAFVKVIDNGAWKAAEQQLQ